MSFLVLRNFPVRHARLGTARLVEAPSDDPKMMGKSVGSTR